MIPTACCAHHSALPTRRFVMAGLACIAFAPGAFAAAAQPVAKGDERFMRIAIEEARRADFPFGAVIVKDGRDSFARPQSGPHPARPDRAWRDGGDPARGPRLRRAGF